MITREKEASDSMDPHLFNSEHELGIDKASRLPNETCICCNTVELEGCKSDTDVSLFYSFPNASEYKEQDKSLINIHLQDHRQVNKEILPCFILVITRALDSKPNKPTYTCHLPQVNINVLKY